jgi:hypothetical protein
MVEWRGLSQSELTDFFVEFGKRIRTDELALGRRHYALGLAHGVRQAIHCGYDRIAAVELGVFRGEGLLDLCKAAHYFREEIGFEILVYGFDRSVGLPEVTNYMDHPEIWHGGDFKMPDQAALKAQLPDFAKLIIGDVGDTLAAFEDELYGNRLGFIAFDVDLYSSTKRALQIFSYHPLMYLPGVPTYFDDSFMSLTRSEWCGEQAAVREFNEENKMRKIDYKHTFRIKNFHVCQIFDHPIRQGRIRPRFPLSLGDF